MSQTPQSVAELFRRYLEGQVRAHTDGLGLADPDGQAVPHEAVPAQPVDPRLAWADALAVVQLASAGRKEPRWQAPPDWPALVAGLGPGVSLAFCVGNFPQMVRDLHPLLRGGDLGALRPAAGRPAPLPASLAGWVQGGHDCPQIFLAVGVLRLARHFDEAAELLPGADDVPAAWRALRDNEAAALAWHRGRADEALRLWQAQEDSVPVRFNRGMASLFLGRPAEAQAELGTAVAGLPDTSAWHHLGQLYLALAAARV